MIFLISTDAPIYYWPWMTLVLIGANAITFLVTGFGHDCDGWILTYGQGLPTPTSQWRRTRYQRARRNDHPTILTVFDQPNLTTNCTGRESLRD